jgi:hypothetical protein
MSWAPPTNSGRARNNCSATADSARCSDNGIGAAQLLVVWSDPGFDATRPAFYYVRVLQILTPRHSLYAAVAMKKPHPENYPTAIQERAYSSPIW